jgi:hypothetical protein
VTRNVATRVMAKPRRKEGHPDAMIHCWTAGGGPAVFSRLASHGPPDDRVLSPGT